jgi:hypothetical protein
MQEYNRTVQMYLQDSEKRMYRYTMPDRSKVLHTPPFQDKIKRKDSTCNKMQSTPFL